MDDIVAEKLPSGPWLTDGSLVYLLEDTAMMVGKGADYRPQQRNRFWFNVYAHHDHPQAETVELAGRIARMLNAAPPVAESPMIDSSISDNEGTG